MRKALSLCLALVLGLFLSACGASELDTSDAESFTESLRKIYDDTSGQEREDFRKYFYIAMNGKSENITQSVLDDKEIEKLGIFYNVLINRRSYAEVEDLDGLTAKDIIKVGKELRIKYLQGRKAGVESDLASLEAETALFLQNNSESAKVKLVLPGEASAQESESRPGIVGPVELAVEVNNESSLKVVGLIRRDNPENGLGVTVSFGNESQTLSDVRVLGPDSLPASEGSGIEPGHTGTLIIWANIEKANWSYPPETGLKAEFPDDMVPLLEGLGDALRAKVAYERTEDLKKQLRRLEQQLAEVGSPT
jgi:hypothetical protein